MTTIALRPPLALPRATWPGRLFAMAVGLLVFLPYPAFPVGSNSAVQLGHLCVLALLGLFAVGLVRLTRRSLAALGLVVVPPFVSTALTIGAPAAMTNLSAAVLFSFNAAAILVGAYAWRRGPVVLLRAVAVVVLVHVAVGALQVYYFARDVFPLQGLFVNPSFADLAEAGGEMALYVKRPFGLMPEPSAMSASLGPWLVLLWSSALGVNEYVSARGVRRGLLWAALIGGTTLMVLSRSGGTAFFGLGLVGLLVLRYRRVGARTAFVKMIYLVGGVAITGLVVYLVVTSLQERFSGWTADSSWSFRMGSILAGFDLVTRGGFSSIAVGMGFGGVVQTLTTTTIYNGIHSLYALYLCATGLVGFGVVLGTVALLRKLWRRRLTSFAIAGGVLVLGLALVTGYNSLLAMWTLFGVLVEVGWGPPSDVRR